MIGINEGGRIMFDFFGTFLDGPLAGSTFGGVINDGSGGDSVGPFLALGGMAFVLAIVLSIIIAPFVAWPSLIASDLNEGRGIWGAIIGAVAGSLLFSPITGLLFMPFLGALLAELIFARKNIMNAFRAGSGAALGMLAGLLLEFTCGLLIIAWFCSCCFLF